MIRRVVLLALGVDVCWMPCSYSFFHVVMLNDPLLAQKKLRKLETVVRIPTITHVRNVECGIHQMMPRIESRWRDALVAMVFDPNFGLERYVFHFKNAE